MIVDAHGSTACGGSPCGVVYLCAARLRTLFDHITWIRDAMDVGLTL